MRSACARDVKKYSGTDLLLRLFVKALISEHYVVLLTWAMC